MDTEHNKPTILACGKRTDMVSSKELHTALCSYLSLSSEDGDTIFMSLLGSGEIQRNGDDFVPNSDRVAEVLAAHERSTKKDDPKKDDRGRVRQQSRYEEEDRERERARARERELNDMAEQERRIQSEVKSRIAEHEKQRAEEKAKQNPISVSKNKLIAAIRYVTNILGFQTYAAIDNLEQNGAIRKEGWNYWIHDAEVQSVLDEYDSLERPADKK